MDKKKKLKHLMEKNGIIVLAGVHDALSARIAQDVGFQGIAMSGNGAMASLLGRPDLSLATMTEMTGRARQIASCVDIPMMSDERYEELTRQNAIENYTRNFGKAPECIEDALEYNRQLAEVIIQVGAEDKTA